MATVRLEGVTKDYGATRALDGVTFDAREGEFLTLFGPSGAGKTTTLELIAGIKADYQGRISIGDRAMEGVPIQERNVAMAFENYALYPHFTVGENIAFPLRSPRAPKRSAAEIAARVQAIADQLGIGHLLDRNPVQLSGGQKQRVGLARALVREPVAYLLDEPIAHLDAKLRTVARANLKDMANRIGTTILYVTHDYREALGLSDRVVILREGRVEQVGTPREIFDAPATDYVAHLVGDPMMNLIDGEVEETGDGFVFRSHQLEFTATAQCRDKLVRTLGLPGEGGAGSRRIRLGIRPADVALDPTPGPQAPFVLPVYGLERVDHHMIVHVELGETILAAKVPPVEGLKIGQPVGLSFDMTRAHYFRKSFEVMK